MSGPMSRQNDVDVDLAQLMRSVAANWWRIVAVSLIITALAFAAAWFATPKYRAETRLLIETRESVFTQPDQREQNRDPIFDQQGVQSQVEVITSTDLLKKVAADLDLARFDEFEATGNLSMLKQLMVLVGLSSDPNEVPPEERVLKAFREKLDVYVVDNSRVIVIEFSSSDPRRAAEVANSLADAYIGVQRAAKLQSNADATEWLGPEIEDLRQRVKDAEARVASYRSQSDLLIGQNNSVLSTQQLSELSSELSRVRANRAAAEATAESVRSALESGRSIENLPSVLESTLIQRLRERQIQLRADIADLSTTLLSNHPRIRALNSQLADLDQQIASEARKVLAGLENEAQTARFRERQLVADLNQLKAESARAGSDEVELRALEREAGAQRELLESYLTRFREASSRTDRNYLPADARIFSRAVTPSEPYFPKILPITAAAFIGSLLLMAIVTLLGELFSGRAMRPAYRPMAEPRFHDVPEPQVAALAVVEEPAPAPKPVEAVKPRETVRPVVVETAPAKIVEPTPVRVVEPTPVAAAVAPAQKPVEPEAPKKSMGDELREAFRKIRDESEERQPVAAAWTAPVTPMQRERTSAQPRRAAMPVRMPEPVVEQGGDEVDVAAAAEHLIVAGVDRAIFLSPEGDAAAASAVLVAREIADSGLKVVLLDLTSSGAASVPMLESKSYPGITNLLASEVQFTDVLHADLYSECHVVPVGTANAARAMRAADRLPMILDALNGAYDLVVIECGPADPAAIDKLQGDRTEVVLSVVSPDDAAVADAARKLARHGHRDPMKVNPTGTMPPEGGSRAA